MTIIMNLPVDYIYGVERNDFYEGKSIWKGWTLKIETFSPEMAKSEASAIEGVLDFLYHSWCRPCGCRQLRIRYASILYLLLLSGPPPPPRLIGLY
jgi:hypothetical protein